MTPLSSWPKQYTSRTEPPELKKELLYIAGNGYLVTLPPGWQETTQLPLHRRSVQRKEPATGAASPAEESTRQAEQWPSPHGVSRREFPLLTPFCREFSRRTTYIRYTIIHGYTRIVRIIYIHLQWLSYFPYRELLDIATGGNLGNEGRETS